MAGTNISVRDIEQFNDFIHNMELLDIPLLGRRFTWSRPNGQARSRIDRFLVFVSWRECWPHCSQLVLDRDISDHCPLLLCRTFQDWGPKPFCVLNCWLQDSRFPLFVEQAWSNLQVQGWAAAIVLKDKMKFLKQELKQWNKDIFGDLRTKRSAAVEKINALDRKEEEVGLTNEEVLLRQSLLSDFWEVLMLHESLLWQQSRSKWIKDDDQNLKYFHSVINWRRKANVIVGLMIDGVWEEDPTKIKVEVKRFFEAKFSSGSGMRPKLDGVPFRTLTSTDNDLLTAMFGVAEINAAVWDCGRDKSPRPYGFNFKFLQKFWHLY